VVQWLGPNPLKKATEFDHVSEGLGNPDPKKGDFTTITMGAN